MRLIQLDIFRGVTVGFLAVMLVLTAVVWTTQALRQPGSAWKLFVYLAALEAGYTPNDRVVDTPVEIDGWSPRTSSALTLR